MKKNIHQISTKLANRIRTVKNIQTDNFLNVSFLKLLDSSSDSCNDYCKILIRVIANSENTTENDSEKKTDSDKKEFLKKLLNLYLFFKEIDNGKLEVYMNILKLETKAYKTMKEISKVEDFYFPKHHDSNDDLPF